MKFLLWGVIGFIVVMWLARTRKITPHSEHGRQSGAESKERGVEAMVRCAQCGMHIPLSEAIVDQSHIAFCSEAHRLRHISD